LIALFVCIVAAVYADIDIDIDAEWKNFKVKHGKLFLSGKKENKRKEAFQANLIDKIEHNKRFEAGEVTFMKGMYAHSDLTREEFKARKQGANVKPDSKMTPVEIHLRAPPPKNWDIRKDGPGKLNAVKDQAECGSCWTFSTTGSVENRYSVKSNILVSLSEQQQVDCVYPDQNGCDGGWFDDAYNYTTVVGLALESKYLYSGVYGKCRAASVEQAVKTKGFIHLNNDPTTIKNALSTGGACGVCVDADYWSKYKSGVFQDARYNKKRQCNHAVTLVGYGTDPTTKLDYWTIRNSWGQSWGEAGHIRVATTVAGSLFSEFVFCPTF